MDPIIQQRVELTGQLSTLNKQLIREVKKGLSFIELSALYNEIRAVQTEIKNLPIVSNRRFLIYKEQG